MVRERRWLLVIDSDDERWWQRVVERGGKRGKMTGKDGGACASESWREGGRVAVVTDDGKRWYHARERWRERGVVTDDRRWR